MKRQLCLIVWMMLGASQGWAACINPPLSPEFINQFKANPPEVLIPGPDADARGVEGTARDLAGSDGTLAKDLVDVAKNARPRYQAAIAAGLAQAALACLNVDQQASLQIQQAVAGFENGEFQTLFAAVVGDLSTAATAAAASAATSSVGSVVIINRNVLPRGNVNPARQGGSNSSASSLIDSFNVGFNRPVSVGQTSSAPVSPTR